MVKDRAEAARGSADLGIGSKSVRYVIQMRDSKSSTNSGGQPPSWPGSSYANEESKLLEAESGGVSGLFGGGSEGVSTESEGGVSVDTNAGP